MNQRIILLFLLSLLPGITLADLIVSDIAPVDQNTTITNLPLSIIDPNAATANFVEDARLAADLEQIKADIQGGLEGATQQLQEKEELLKRLREQAAAAQGKNKREQIENLTPAERGLLGLQPDGKDVMLKQLEH